jgi:pimeloyl-ACP methyl ester carboxylesterase
MLALAFAAAYPEKIACLALIGCGTFDPAARQLLEATREERMGEDLVSRMKRLAKEFADADKRLLALGRLIQKVDSYDLLPAEDETERCDSRAHEETWQDMLRLQAEGVYPAAFADIRSPVIMMHGVVDPHPGRMIYASLVPYLPQLEYREWARCGHYPWLERAVRDEFHATLRAWLSRNTTYSASPSK